MKGMVNFHRTVPLLIAGVTGVLMLAETVLVSREIGILAGSIRNWVIIIAGFSLVLGGTNIIAVHGKLVMKRTANRWPFSLLLLTIMAIYVVIGLTLTTASAPYAWLFDTINFPTAQITWALMLFFAYSAAARAFQARNFEATLFLLSTLFVVLGNIPSLTLVSPILGAVGPWITDVPTKGGFRGLLITAAIGGIILGIRTLLGRETGYLGRR
jgi:hypothetical protein